MLNINASRILNSQNMLLSAAVASVQEGALLSVVMEGGQARVTPSTGGSAEIIAGFARSQYLNPISAPRTEDLVIPASGTYAVTLARTPIAPDTNSSAVLLVAGVPTSAFVWDTTPDATLDYWISGNVLTVFSADAGKTIRVTYEYNLTIAERDMIYGQGINDGGQGVTGGTDVITDAQVLFTDKFDKSDNWNVGGPVYSGAGGIVTLKNTGTLLPRVYVMSAPNGVGFGAFLGLYVSI